jgi:hypothetical protein
MGVESRRAESPEEDGWPLGLRGAVHGAVHGARIVGSRGSKSDSELDSAISAIKSQRSNQQDEAITIVPESQLLLQYWW